MSFCQHCIQGVRHEGEPEGTLETIGGVACYIATPTIDYVKDKVILLLPDAFGIGLINSKLMTLRKTASRFAPKDVQVHGYDIGTVQVVVIDYYNGDSLPPDALNDKTLNFRGWLATHGAEVTCLPLDKVIAALTEEGITRFGATSYCFGGRYTFVIAFDKVIQCAVVAHPSLLEVPKDLEATLITYFIKAKVPLLINACKNDRSFPAESQAKAGEISGDGKFAPGYRLEYFPGCTHEFAVRGDLTDPLVKAGKEEGSFKTSVGFFLTYL
ncbi:uncharacterized protein EDB91DRAFT_1249022 [Suillus paluster]|uniref:uncharacterized protein n=1 Tax=Suillus paluster TaxID=48578 RepID=UPI001B874EDD|nr:uncharacterized protein EDB91DRAFT_1249022 [Suillus paluster]KAG1738863.1 hypothetical protein EDB91DRAFT_1249022 [Suillus paluster]